jgi:diguanylate cyclase
MIVRITSRAHVVRYTLLITALTVIVPVAVVAGALWPVRLIVPELYTGGIAISALIPLFITPPIAFAGLHVLRLLHETIERINDHVRFDHLTGVFNRSHFLDQVRASRCDGMLLIVDADHFKAINDQYGHDVGDEALKLLGALLLTGVGTVGLVGRLGGEEFGVFIPGGNARMGDTIARQLGKSVREGVFAAGDASLGLTISIGGALHHESSPIGHSLKIADERLYAAKHDGRDCYVGEVFKRDRVKMKLAQAR